MNEFDDSDDVSFHSKDVNELSYHPKEYVPDMVMDHHHEGPLEEANNLSLPKITTTDQEKIVEEHY